MAASHSQAAGPPTALVPQSSAMEISPTEAAGGNPMLSQQHGGNPMQMTPVTVAAQTATLTTMVPTSSLVQTPNYGPDTPQKVILKSEVSGP